MLESLILLRWLRNLYLAEPRIAGSGSVASGVQRTHTQGAFKLEALEPRILLSGDSLIASEIQRTLIEDEAMGAGARVEAVIENIDAATKAEIASVGADNCGGAQAQLGVSVAWSESWQVKVSGESSTAPDCADFDEADAGSPVAYSAAVGERETLLQEQAAERSAALETSEVDGDASRAVGEDQDTVASVIPVSELPRGPPSADALSSALIAVESIQNNELSPFDLPEGDEGGSFGVREALFVDFFDDAQVRAPPEYVTLSDEIQIGRAHV